MSAKKPRKENSVGVATVEDPRECDPDSGAPILEPPEEDEGLTEEIPVVAEIAKASPSSSFARNRIADLEESRRMRALEDPF